MAPMTWGLSDRRTWLSTAEPRADGLPVRPLPLDADLKRKPAWGEID
jgi:endo-1,4-beta-xylanase